jgi:hypothetical protein
MGTPLTIYYGRRFAYQFFFGCMKGFSKENGLKHWIKLNLNFAIFLYLIIFKLLGTFLILFISVSTLLAQQELEDQWTNKSWKSSDVKKGKCE